MKLNYNLAKLKKNIFLFLRPVMFIRAGRYLYAESNEFNVIWSSLGAICATYHLGLACWTDSLWIVFCSLFFNSSSVFMHMRSSGDPLPSWEKADSDYIGTAEKIRAAYSPLWCPYRSPYFIFRSVCQSLRNSRSAYSHDANF